MTRDYQQSDRFFLTLHHQFVFELPSSHHVRLGYVYLAHGLLFEVTNPLTKNLIFPDDAQDAHQQVYGEERHEGKLSHEVLAGGAAFEGMKLFEDHQRKEGGIVIVTRRLSESLC